MSIFSNSAPVSHSTAQFTARCNRLFEEEEFDEFIRCAFTGEYRDDDGVSRQVFLDLDSHYLNIQQLTETHRDFDSAIGISQHILVAGPISVWAAPHTGHELKTSIHLEFSDLNVSSLSSLLNNSIECLFLEDNTVPYHKIPNFELGTFGTRHSINVFFPKLWSRERACSQPYLTTEKERLFWYTHGFRKAIQTLGTDIVASEYPATTETEAERAKKKNGQMAWGTKMIDRRYVSQLADQIRREIRTNTRLDAADIDWAADFFFIHMIRGVKQAYIHGLDALEAEYTLTQLFADAQLSLDAHQKGEWWIDVGIEVSSSEGLCLQWTTSSHRSLVELALGVNRDIAHRITRISSSRYYRDLSGHLLSLSGFRLEPGSRASGDYEAAYLQAYTTDKAIVYNTDGGHHAKFLTAREALSSKQPSPTIQGLYTIYEQARCHNPSKARLEVRVPYHFAADALLNLEDDMIRGCLCAFTCTDWWNLRLLRLTACSQVLSLQAAGDTEHRFMPETLLLTAACIWLVNSLHARPEDGPAARELMRAILPLTEASDDDGTMVESAAYNPNRKAEWMYEEEESDDEESMPLIPYHPHGYFFLRRIKLEEHGVPRMRASSRTLSPSSFHFLFDRMTRGEVIMKFSTSGVVSSEAIATVRLTTNKRPTVQYVNVTGDQEPVLFNLSTLGYSLVPLNRDTGSDLDERETPPPEDNTNDIDAFASQLWRQMVVDIKSKTPNQKGITNPSYCRLNRVDRQSADEAPFKTLNLGDVFRAVWYKNADKQQWKIAFDKLLPGVGHKAAANIQNYSSCQYYKKWTRILDANKSNPAVINAIRDAFWKRIRHWSWIPNAQADKMWMTSIQNARGRGFKRLPDKPGDPPAPYIYLHSQATPTFDEDVEMDD